MQSITAHLAIFFLVILALPLQAGMLSFRSSADDEPSAAATEDSQSSDTTSSGVSYLISDKNLFDDAEVFWPGFLTGMRSTHHFQERFAEPVGNPIYFESPFIETQVKMFYLWHDFPSNSQIGGGQANIWAAQIRLALTDRLAFIATKDGWTELNAGILPRASGWNDFAIGLKYALIVDEPNNFILTSGLRWEWHNGNLDIAQGGDGGDDELSPFVSFGKAWGQWNVIGSLSGRLPMDHNDGNFIVSWDLHVDCEVAPDALPGFHPLLEIHALHYLTNADRTPLSVGGLDYTNIGASDVAGNNVFWGDLGFRWKLTPNLSWGVAYGFPISNPGNSIFNQRVTVDLVFSY